MPLVEEPGDATDLPAGQRVILAHGCNDAGRWGAGFTAAINRRWPDVQGAYLAWEGGTTPVLRTLGQVQFLSPRGAENVVVANMITQRGVRSSRVPMPLDRGALGTCLLTVLRAAGTHGYRVYMPRVGCGLGGGQWDGAGGVRGILEAALSAYPSVHVTVRTG